MESGGFDKEEENGEEKIEEEKEKEIKIAYRLRIEIAAVDSCRQRTTTKMLSRVDFHLNFID